MAVYKIELKKVLDEHIQDIISELEEDADFDSVEDLEAYINEHIHQPDGCVFLDLHVDIPTPFELEEK